MGHLNPILFSLPGKAAVSDRTRPQFGAFPKKLKFSFKIGVGTTLLAFAFLTASAAEMATLRNGFAIRHERHEVRDSVTRLYLTDAAENYVDVPSTEISSFEEIVPRLPPKPAPDSDPDPAIDLDAMVSAASSRNNVDPDLIFSVIRAESGFNPNAVSRKGAQGLMQLMPETAARLGVQNAFDPAANVEGGTLYLGQLLARYHNDVPLALAAYNAGPERVEQYQGVPPYQETRVYVARIIRDLTRKKAALRASQINSSSSRSAGQDTKPVKPNATAHHSLAAQ